MMLGPEPRRHILADARRVSKSRPRWSNACRTVLNFDALAVVTPMVSKPSQSVSLRTKKDKRSLPLLRVVISGVASRQALLMDQLDDLQLAVEILLVEEGEGNGDMLLEVSPLGGGLSVAIAGLGNQRLKKSLLGERTESESQEFVFDARMLLEALVDAFRVDETTDGAYTVQLEKRA
jgi:hypothetical protein